MLVKRSSQASEALRETSDAQTQPTNTWTKLTAPRASQPHYATQPEGENNSPVRITRTGEMRFQPWQLRHKFKFYLKTIGR